ncbi:MAG: FAD-dependent oxidoreductase, partial [Phaeodactylibacter sp.]|nr:FAD-dependent oxidoreductase [Phaeodactylibacter sp.]
MIQTDVLIIGAGIAGLTTAIKLARKRPDLQITILTKTHEQESNTSYAQGGVAAVWDPVADNYEKHIADTLDAGDGLCKEDIVEIVVTEGPTRVQEIIDWGARFDKDAEGYDLGREGGHSENRILHYKDITGWEIQRTLLEELEKAENVTFHEHYFAIDLLTQHHLGYNITRVTPGIECYGAYVLNKETQAIETIIARVTVLASGGAGQVYKNTTNPVIATGDGIAMMYRAKGRIENMEFVQFHPTGIYGSGCLITEGARGEGGYLT